MSMSAPLPYHTPLDAAQQTAFGLPAPAPFAMADRVKFSELDPLDHVNNVAYISWFENIRIRYFNAWNISHYRPADPRIVIRKIDVDYLAEMRLHDDYVVTARCANFRTTSFTLKHEVWRGSTRCAAADAVIVLLNPDGSARLPIPADVLETFAARDGAHPA